MSRSWIDLPTVERQLEALGLSEGSVVQVHCAFSKVAPIASGPEGLIEALRNVVGTSGTIVMPSMTADDDSVFDPRTTSCIDLGVVADTFWRQPGVARSDNPHAFAACGAMADRITSPHPVVVPHGLDSPVGRVLDLDGWVLLVGIGHEANTTIHLAEVLERAVYSLPVRSTLRERGRVRRVYYAEVGGCSERFALLDGPLEASGAQRRGLVGHATARLVRARDVVDAAREAMQADPFVFLHAPGACDTCDQASAWIPHHLRKAQRGEAIDDPRRDVTAP